MREVVKKEIHYDTRCYFNVRLKAGVSQLNLPHDKTYAAIRKKREAKGKDKNRCQELKAEDRKSSECINSNSWKACAWN